MQDKSHWESVYTHKAADAVSWFQPHADSSLALIRQTGIALDLSLIHI